MREILFRGKLISTGKMVYGYLLQIAEETRIYSTLDFPHGTDWFLVDPSTVGQYTGLTDKNGTKIFEGDVVQAHFRNNHSKQKFRVLFDDGMFLFDNNCVKVPKYEIYAMKVIGNIHDNPELLEVSGDA